MPVVSVSVQVPSGFWVRIKIFDAALEAGAVRVVEGAQAHDGPGGLRGGAGAVALENRVVVGVAAFAPAAVLVLDAFQPVAGLEDPGLAHVHAQGAQAAQDLPGAVNIIDAPAAVPRAVRFLVVADEFQRLFAPADFPA